MLQNILRKRGRRKGNQLDVFSTSSPYRKELSKDDEIKELKESFKKLKIQLRERKRKVPVRNTTQHTSQLNSEEKSASGTEEENVS